MSSSEREPIKETSGYEHERQRVIACAALAGCTFELVAVGPYRVRKKTHVRAFLPDGLPLSALFNDQFEAAQACLFYIKATEAGSHDVLTETLTRLFTLADGQEPY